RVLVAEMYVSGAAWALGCVEARGLSVAPRPALAAFAAQPPPPKAVAWSRSPVRAARWGELLAALDIAPETTSGMVALCGHQRSRAILVMVRREPPPSAPAPLLHRLRRRVAVEQRLREDWIGAAALAVSMDALHRPAFLLGPSAVVVRANAGG